MAAALAAASISAQAQATTPTSSTAPSPASSIDLSKMPLPSIPDRTFNVMDYGAAGDGQTDDTAHLQAAIDACAAADGGTILLPAGKSFVSNFLIVKSNNTRVQIAGNLLCQVYGKYTDASKSLITFSHAHDVEICGPGVIEGRGNIGPDGGWWRDKPPGSLLAASDRPRLVRFASCNTVYIHDITMRNSPSMHVIFGATDNVTIRHLTIYAPSSSASQLRPGEVASHNTDGIDPHGSNYLIDDCNISDGDDDIVFVASSTPSHNFLVRNCQIGTGHGLSVSGTGELSGLTVTNCTFNGTTNGIRFKTWPTDARRQTLAIPTPRQTSPFQTFRWPMCIFPSTSPTITSLKTPTFLKTSSNTPVRRQTR
jgi:polygalacturonase